MQHAMQRYVDEASKPDVAEAVENTAIASRVEFVKDEVARLRVPKASDKVHENRQQQAMNLCGARLKRPPATDNPVDQ